MNNKNQLNNKYSEEQLQKFDNSPGTKMCMTLFNVASDTIKFDNQSILMHA